MAAGVDAVVRDTLAWLERAVIGLNLCPFAKSVMAKGQVHVAVCLSAEAVDVLDALTHEAQSLVALPAAIRDTTLLVVPHGLDEFLEFNDVVARGERLLRRQKLQGVLQLASFHPRFEFAGSAAHDMGNYTNRAPYPTLHLLREASVDRAVQAFPDAGAIYDRNIETLERLGPDGWAELGVGRTA